MLRKQGTSYTHIVFGNVTQFDKFLRAMVNSVTPEVVRGIKGCNKVEELCNYACHLFLNIFDKLEMTLLLIEPEIL
jgi:hypothetical protein